MAEFAEIPVNFVSNGTRNRVRIGGATKAEILSLLAKAKVKLNPLAEELFSDARFTTRQQVSFVEIVTVTVAALGFRHGATFAQLVATASSQELTLCPLELAAHLRLQFTGQPEGSLGHPRMQGKAPHGSLTVAAEPPSDEQDEPWGFYLRRVDGDLWLRGYRSWSGHLWSPEDHIAFALEQNAV